MLEYNVTAHRIDRHGSEAHPYTHDKWKVEIRHKH